MSIHKDDEFDSITTLEDWVMSYVNDWQEYYENNYEQIDQEYYRIFRGIWANQDKTRDSERSRLITPATQQAVESSVAEVEEATFGRGHWFDMRDDADDPEKEDIIAYRKKLEVSFAKNKVRKGVSEVLINAAVFGNGIAEVVLDETEDRTVATQPMMEGSLMAVGVNVGNKVSVKLRPVLPQNFRIDPVATCIDESIGVAIDENVTVHSVQKLINNGTYNDVDVFADTTSELDREPDPNLAKFPDDKIRLVKWFGEVPKYLLEKANLEEDESDEDLEDEGEFVEAIVVIANSGTLLKAEENPYMMQDRPIVAFAWDIVPGLFRGRGVVEKAYNSQKALDAEIRARVDALAYTIHPMMAVNSSKFIRGSNTDVRPGKTIFCNGNPSEALMPINFGSVDQITFAQAGELQKMVRQATGAIDSLADLGGQARTDGGISASLGAIIKRHKRTLLGFQDNFLIPFVEKAAWRYMQFDPDNYPAKDYNFNTTSTLGIMAREYETAQLTQLLQTMSPESPAYDVLIQAIIDNSSVTNREELIITLQKAKEQSPEQQQEQQRVQKLQEDFQSSQTAALNGQAAEAQARAQKYAEETRLMPEDIKTNRIKAMASMEDEDTKQFSQRVQMANTLLKEREVATKERDPVLKGMINGR